MSALPKQNVVIGKKFDLSGSGRLWTHRGEWSYQTVMKVEVLEQTFRLCFWIRPNDQGYTLTFDGLFYYPRTCPLTFASPEEAARWFEMELSLFLSIRRAEDRVWLHPQDEDQLDLFEAVDFEEVHCG